MKAAWYERTGPASEVLVLGEMDDPTPGPGEVRVRMAFSGVNPSDVKRRAGWNNQQMPFPRVIPNMDGSGVIDAVGVGVEPARLGERVWLHSTAWQRPFGTAADLVTTPAHRAYPLPASATLAVGAGLGVPAMTAHRSVFGLGAVKDKTVLVTGGAGAVGFYSIQLAKWGGAEVIATVSNAEKGAAALRAGADHVVNYKAESVADRVMALSRGQGVDHVIEVDFGANVLTSVALLKPGGSMATYASMTQPEPALPFYPMMFKNLQVLWVFVYDLSREVLDRAACDIARWLSSGQAVHPANRRFPLDRIADAHLAVERGATGKVLVEVGGE